MFEFELKIKNRINKRLENLYSAIAIALSSQERICRPQNRKRRHCF